MQSKFTSPLLGYNNNVRHKARVFHIQTEDSGVKHPHIITHLFMDGGRILKSVKKSYAEHVGVDGMTDIVKTMMKEQHKAMFIALRDGQFDHLVDPAAAAAAATASVAAGAPAKDPAPASSAAVAAASPASTKEATAAAVASPAVAAAALPPVAPGPPPSAGPGPASVTAPSAPMSAAAAASERGAPAVSSSSQPVPTDASPPMSASEEEPAASDGATQIAAPSPAPSLTLDIDALERAAKDAEGGSPLFQSHSDLPPPPENLFRDRPAASGYRGQPGIEERPRSRPPATTPSARQPPVPSAARPSPSSTAGPAGAAGAAGAGSAPRPRPSDPPRRMPPVPASPDARYAPTRPASIFGASRPPPATSTSIFGGDLMSDKSLDEVILSYLAEDLELEGKKK